MLILEQSVTKEYWKATEDYLLRRIRLNRFRKVGRTGVIEVPGGTYNTTYAILDNGHPVAWLCIRARPGWVAYEVIQVFVMKDYRGLGFAQRLYKAAINTDRCLLASGKTHSKYSMGLWKRFVQTNTFTIWAHDFNNIRIRSQVEFEDGELICPLPIYTRKPGKHDIRLIAQRK